MSHSAPGDEPRWRAALERVALGDSFPDEALAAVQSAFRAGGRSGGDRVYASFRSWIWRALTQRLFDDQLESWREVIRRSAAMANKAERADLSQRLQAICDLVDQSIQFSAEVRPDRMLGRRHIPELLLFLSRARSHVDRSQIQRELKLSDSNLSRLLSELVGVGWLERVSKGREAGFRLTERGRIFADTVLKARATRGVGVFGQFEPMLHRPGLQRKSSNFVLWGEAGSNVDLTLLEKSIANFATGIEFERGNNDMYVQFLSRVSSARSDGSADRFKRPAVVDGDRKRPLRTIGDEIG